MCVRVCVCVCACVCVGVGVPYVFVCVRRQEAVSRRAGRQRSPGAGVLRGVSPRAGYGLRVWWPISVRSVSLPLCGAAFHSTLRTTSTVYARKPSTHHL